MSLSNGTKLGPYEILSPLGAGGMGEVYLARDTKLNRDIAIKVLPAAVAQDAERMSRFQREAQTLAALNHPNIAAVYGFLENALVMEYVPGQALAGPLPSGEAMGIARQIAEALEYAHERGIVHRDLKPANIKITPEGVVKVLDFGLAKALEDSPAAQNISNSPTLSIAATKAGIILGTPAYMSPEQARGKPVDKRTDIWAFGCVLYELLTGKPAFDGETVTDVIAAVVNRDPGWSGLPAGPAAAIVRRCLVKDPKRRLRDIGDAFGETEAVVPAAETKPLPAARWKTVAAFTVVVAVTLVAGMWLQSRRTPPANEWTGTLLTGSINAMGPRISPDGKTLAFQAMVDRMTQVAIMKPDSGNWTVLTHERDKGYVLDIHWSADSGTIYFDRWNAGSPGGIFSIPAVGGPERLVLEDANAAGVLPDGSFLVIRVNAERQLQLHRYWPETGRLQAFPVTVLESTIAQSARPFADGREAVFYGTTIGSSQADPLPHFYVLDIASGTTSHIAFGSAGQDVPPLAVDPNRDRYFFTVAKSGDLYDVVAVPRDGNGIPHKLISLTLRPQALDIASDGTFYLDQAQRPFEVMRFPADGGMPERLARSEFPGSRVVLETPDGRVIFSSGISGLERLMVANPGQDPVALMDTREETYGPVALLGEHQLVLLMGRGANCRLAIVSSKDGRLVRRLDDNAERITSVVGSKDGKTIYYLAEGIIWAVPADGGPRRRLGTGDSLALSPDGLSMVVQLNEKEASRLVRLPLGGGDPQKIPFTGPFHLTEWQLSPGAVAPDGRILVTVVADTWFYSTAILDPKTGKVQVVPVNYVADIGRASWTHDGRIVAETRPLNSVLWRFRPVRNQP